MSFLSRLLTLSAALLCLFPTLSSASPQIYPVREVFRFDTPVLATKAPAFAAWVKGRGIAALSNEFDAAFRKEFGSLAAENITDINKHQVLVASLHLIRASQYRVPKLAFDEIHMPITLSIVITNPMTGEAIYSFTKTSYAAARITKQGDEPEAGKLLIDQTASNYRTLLQTLLQEAKQGYSPAKIEATVAKTWKGLLILNKGSKSGIARDDSLMDTSGNEILVKHVSENNAIATALLGKVDSGSAFFKYANLATTGQFVKPKVLTMHEAWQDDNLIEISRYFDSEVSKESAFTLLPANEHFLQMLMAVARDTYAGKFETTQQRELPDYLIKFDYSTPRVYAIREQGKFGSNIYEQYVLGELLDKQGRIIFSAVGHNRIDDQNVAGMVFDKRARLEVVQKNAVINLAEQFSKSIKFSHFVLPVKNVSGRVVEVEDKPRELRIGQGAVIYRNIGAVDGISGEVVVPLWQATVVDAQNGQVKLDPVLPFGDEKVSISEGDVVIVDAVSAAATANQSETSLTYCQGRQSKLGALEIKDFPVLARSAGYLLPYTLYDHDDRFAGLVREAIKMGGFRDSSLRLGKMDTGGRCLLPVHKAAVEKQNCNQGACGLGLSLAAGYRLYVDSAQKGAAASATKTTVEDVRETVLEPVTQGELSKNTLTLLKGSIVKLRFQ